VGLEPGFRVAEREPEPDGASDPDLVARICGEIAATGPITFARFMELALYDPEGGYYRAAAERAGRTGDFLTAPEAHPIFGRALARQLEETWERLDRPRPFVVREYGAGSGALAAALLAELDREGGAAGGVTIYEPVEINAHRREQLGERLRSAGLGERLLPEGSSTPAAHVVIANEFLDALPVHRVIRHGGTLAELHVDWRDGRFVDRAGPLSAPGLEARLRDEGVELAESQAAEVCLGLDAWMSGAAAGMERGYVIVIDYGARAPDLYGPRRPRGTLMGYLAHRAVDDPYASVGRQDLTAHVDFTAVELAGERHGFVSLGLTTQAEFLVGAGMEELLERARSDPRTTMAEWLSLRSSVVRMLDPRAMGAFRVLALGRDVPTDPALRGFSFRLPGSR